MVLARSFKNEKVPANGNGVHSTCNTFSTCTCSFFFNSVANTPVRHFTCSKRLQKNNKITIMQSPFERKLHLYNVLKSRFCPPHINLSKRARDRTHNLRNLRVRPPPFRIKESFFGSKHSFLLDNSIPVTPVFINAASLELDLPPTLMQHTHVSNALS